MRLAKPWYSDGKTGQIPQMKHIFSVKIRCSARSFFFFYLVRKIKMKAIAVGSHNVFPLPGTWEGPSASSPFSAPLPCPLLLFHSPTDSCPFSLYTLTIPSPWKQGQYEGKEDLCGKERERKVNVDNLRSFACRRRVTLQGAWCIVGMGLLLPKL